MGIFTARVANTNDDGQKYVGGAWDTSSVYVGNDSFFGDKIAGVRFNNVTIPQGSTINSAKITFKSSGISNYAYYLKIYGIDEDDTADFSSDPTGRTKTSASVDWDLASGFDDETTYDTSDITTIVQEIVDRGGWASGNDMGFLIEDDGTSNHYANLYDYTDSSSDCALLTIDYTGSSPSASQSPSASSSLSPSVSESRSPSSSDSPSPSFIEPFLGMKIAKPGFNVLTTDDPTRLIFSSDYGTLKYFKKETSQITFDANAGNIAGTATISHNLGYYPYVEVFVDVYIGSSTGTYEYCPFAGSGATVAYDANYKITTSDIVLYAQINGVSSSVWVFDFIVFIYKNNLNL